MTKRFLSILIGGYNQVRFKFNQLMFYIQCPSAVKFANWKNKIILKIGGKINPILENKITRAKSIISVDVSDKYINSKNIIDIQTDAHSLPILNSESVDFIASSHTIEHLTNPLKALSEWRRILRTKGIIYASIPFYKKTFDHKRIPTKIEHLIEDYNNNITLDDDTHNEEFMKNFDIRKDFCFTDYNEWLKNYFTDPKIYTHYHVFDLNLAREMMEFAGFETISIFYNNISIEYYGVKRAH